MERIESVPCSLILELEVCQSIPSIKEWGHTCGLYQQVSRATSIHNPEYCGIQTKDLHQCCIRDCKLSPSSRRSFSFSNEVTHISLDDLISRLFCQVKLGGNLQICGSKEYTELLHCFQDQLNFLYHLKKYSGEYCQLFTQPSQTDPFSRITTIDLSFVSNSRPSPAILYSMYKPGTLPCPLVWELVSIDDFSPLEMMVKTLAYSATDHCHQRSQLPQNQPLSRTTTAIISLVLETQDLRMPRCILCMSLELYHVHLPQSWSRQWFPSVRGGGRGVVLSSHRPRS